MSDQPKKTDSSELQSPGTLLAEHRKKKKMSQAQVAAKLRLSVQSIKDIEADDYRHLRAAIYVRGYLRAYAKLLELAEEPVFAAYNELGYNEQFESREVNVDYVTSSATNHQFERGKQAILRWGSAVIAFVLLLLIVLWWHGQRHNPHALVPANFATSQPSSEPQELQIPVTMTTKPGTSDQHE